MKSSITDFFILPEASIKEAIKKMDSAGQKILFVSSGEAVLDGVVSDGDIRRYILRTGTLSGHVKDCYNKKPFVAKDGSSRESIKELMARRKIEVVPVVNTRQQVIDLLVWNDFFNHRKKKHKKIGVPVIIMAGGKGTRLDPFTRILPKPLIPIGEKPVLELIMERFAEYGAGEFYLTVNYKGEMIKSYFDNIDVNYNINYIWEKEFLGTAGSLQFLPKNITGTFIVSNCDILVDLDYTDLIRYHHDRRHKLTIVGSLHHHVIPYGVIELSSSGNVVRILEKPEYDFTVNTGVYILERDVLKLIPKKKMFHITDLIGLLLKAGEKVGVYPVSEGSYIDIGQWEEYQKNTKRFAGDR